MLGAFLGLFLWNFKEESVGHPLWHSLLFLGGLQFVEDTKWSRQESIRYMGDFDYGCATERIDVLRFQGDNQQDTSAMEPVNGKMG